jgi:hypothetical protein
MTVQGPLAAKSNNRINDAIQTATRDTANLSDLELPIVSTPAQPKILPSTTPQPAQTSSADKIFDILNELPQAVTNIDRFKCLVTDLKTSISDLQASRPSSEDIRLIESALTPNLSRLSSTNASEQRAINDFHSQLDSLTGIISEKKTAILLENLENFPTNLNAASAADLRGLAAELKKCNESKLTDSERTLLSTGLKKLSDALAGYNPNPPEEAISDLKKVVNEQLAHLTPAPTPAPPPAAAKFTVREDYPQMAPEATAEIRELITRHNTLNNDRIHRGNLSLPTLLEKLSNYQVDAQGNYKIDPNSEYKVKNREQFTDTIKTEIDAFLKKEGSPITVDQYIDQLMTAPGVRFLHVITPPVIDKDIFRVRYVDNTGSIITYEMNSSAFYRRTSYCHYSTIKALGLAALSTAATIGALSLGPVAAVASFSIGSYFLRRLKWTTDETNQAASSEYKNIVGQQTLDQAKNGNNAPSLILPILAHAHFIQQVPDDALAIKLGVTNPESNTPFKYLQQHFDACLVIINKWDLFEAECDNFNTRQKNPNTVTNIRTQEIDEKIIRMQQDAREFEATLMRRPEWFTEWTGVVTGYSSPIIGYIIEKARLGISRFPALFKPR